MKSFPVLLFCSIILLTSCGDSSSCLENIVCTEEFRMITVEITDAIEIPVVLDSAYSLHQDAGIQYFEDDQFFAVSEGIYTVWTDAEFDLVEKKGTELIFEGWLNKEKVISQPFLIGHDCCHIELLEGPAEISL